MLCHFAGTVRGRQGAALRRSSFPHKRPVTCGHRPASPDACGRDFRCAVAPLKCGRNLRFPHNPPSLFTRTPIARELLPAGVGSFCLLKLCSRVSDCYSAPLPLGTSRGCFFIWSNRLLPKAGRLRAGGLHIIEGTQGFAILQELSGVARALLSAGAVPPQTPPPFYMIHAL